ncbi:MAG TPA: metalloregulator ArsR/SmtB family transcription factor [Phycisphaerales bacterium]|nr:metalloregulator ArsR/SmtB family transcription factor [Phycisphaerales bacterium]
MLDSLTQTASALSDPTRLRLLAAVIDAPSATGEVCVCDLTDLVDLAPSTVSKHLSILRDAGLIEGRKDGRWMHYRANRNPEARALRDALDWVRLAKATDKQLLADATRIRTIVCTAEPGRCCTTAAPDAKGARPRVLFLCTGNSCRSQMAEGWARRLKPDLIDAHSAGTTPQGLNPLAVKVMREVGIDISRATSKRPEDIGVPFDLVITVCDSARESCPILPGAPRTIHVGFDDPPHLARNAASEDEALTHYRRIRDEIRAFVQTLPESIQTTQEHTHAQSNTPVRS